MLPALTPTYTVSGRKDGKSSGPSKRSRPAQPRSGTGAPTGPRLTRHCSMVAGTVSFKRSPTSLDFSKRLRLHYLDWETREPPR